MLDLVVRCDGRRQLNTRRAVQRTDNNKNTVGRSATAAGALTAMTVTPLFLEEERKLAEHVDALRSLHDEYIVQVLWNVTKGVTMAQSTKIRVLAALWGTGERDVAAQLLAYEDHFTVPVVLGALQLLDSKRKAKQLDSKLKKLDQSARKSRAKLGSLKTRRDSIKALEQEVVEVVEPAICGVSGALQRHVARWVRAIPKEKLEFWLLALPKEPWVEISQLCHLNPKKDFGTVPWFLHHAYGEAPPDGSLAASAADF
eukprot:COSAG02_NODE_17816_length_979_cov_0.755682_1_plen_256_part_01